MNEYRLRLVQANSKIATAIEYSIKYPDISPDKKDLQEIAQAKSLLNSILVDVSNK